MAGVLLTGHVGAAVLAEQHVLDVLGVGVLAHGGDLAVADGEDAEIAVMVGGAAPGGGA
jgi:hypothetical protein